MDTAIRWTSGPGKRFLIADVAGNRLQHCQVTFITDNSVQHKVISQQDNLANFSAFDWCRTDENLVGIGTDSAIRVIALDTEPGLRSTVNYFPHKQPRRTNSIAWNSATQIACGLERQRGEPSLHVYDPAIAGPGSEPLVRLAGGDSICSIKFGYSDPNLVIAGTPSKGLRLFDIRGKSCSSSSILKGC